VTTPRQAFEAAQKQRLRERAVLILSTDQAVIAELQGVRAQIVHILSGQPADWQLWQLSKLLQQIDALLGGATGRAAAALDGGLRTAWQQGEAFIDKPLAAGGLNVQLYLPTAGIGVDLAGGAAPAIASPMLNADTVLTSLRQFAALRLKDVGAEAARNIGRELSLVTIGAKTPFDAIKEVQQLLESHSPARAAMIVRTEVARAFAMSSHQRLLEASKVVPGGLQKMWRRSGKVHSRWNHDAIDGQTVDADKPFLVPTLNEGTIEMMYPHDPTAPAGEVVNCGCLALTAAPKGWNVATPGAKPFTQLELQQDGRKAALDQAAKRAGLRAS
jgi:hypothetical protein